MHKLTRSFLAACAWWFAALASAQVPQYEARLLQEFPASDAWQGVAVDAQYFYAVNNTRISRHDKNNGQMLLRNDRTARSPPLIHMDSAVAVDGKLYAAHSNYPYSPMLSSIEIWDSSTLQHLGSHSFGEYLGSLTWVDYFDGYWWAGFANYDMIQPGSDQPYGTTAASRLVKMNSEFTVLQQWSYPPELLARFTPMSNSGGSWGPDGRLYITGHDHPEVYVVQLPQQGSAAEWLATVAIPQIAGQGIAWDRSAATPVLWGILRRDRKVFSFAMPEITALASRAP